MTGRANDSKRKPGPQAPAGNNGKESLVTATPRTQGFACPFASAHPQRYEHLKTGNCTSLRGFTNLAVLKYTASSQIPGLNLQLTPATGNISRLSI